MSSTTIFIDVREPHEYHADHINIAINIPLSEIVAGTKQLENIDKNTELIVYCRSGGRSNISIQHLKRMGFTNLVNGINAENITKNYLS